MQIAKRQHLMLLVILLVVISSVFYVSSRAYATNGADESTVESVTGSAPVVTATEGNEDVTGKLTNVVETSDFPIDGSFEAGESFSVNVSFNIPVEGDTGSTVDSSVHLGDTASFVLGENITLDESMSNPITLKAKTGEEVAVVYFDDTVIDSETGNKILTANVTFTADTDDDGNVVANTNVYDPNSGIGGVSAEFSIMLGYGGNGESGADDATDIIQVLGSTYVVQIPAVKITYTIDKSGAVNWADQSVTWTTNITAAQLPDTSFNLEDYIFSDDLTDVGSYIPGSLTVGSTGEILLSQDNASGEAKDISAVSYVFPSGSSSPQTVTFKTEIPDEKYYSSGEQKIKNTAQLKDTDEVVGESSAEVTFTPNWIEKSGVADDTPTESTYDPENRTITWTIVANTDKAKLSGVKITDVLQDDLVRKSSTYQIGEGSKIAITPTDGIYDIGAVAGTISDKVTLVIVTTVPPEDQTTTVKTFNNSASISWAGLPDGTFMGTGDVGVGVGYTALTKTGEVNTADRSVKWTVNVDLKGQNTNDLKAYDLLVYGSDGTDLASSDLASYLTAAGISGADISTNYNQKYMEGTFEGSADVIVNVTPIYNGDEQVADLLVITGLSKDSSNTFSFSSRVMNPDIYAGNNTNGNEDDVSNTVNLFNSTTRIASASDGVNYPSNMLAKEMLVRGASTDTLAGVNNKTTSTKNGFDYQDKSVIFRLSINASGVDYTRNDLDSSLGIATVTDTLPDGWEFVPITDDENAPYFVAYDGDVNSSGRSVTASDPLGLTDGPTGTFQAATTTTKAKAVFTFTDLTSPYVILVKARPTAEIALGYFDSNKTTSVTNDLDLNSKEWNSGVSNSQKVSIVSEILAKSYTKDSDGILNWSVDYKTADTDQPGTELEDTLPVGLDLRTDSSGALIIDGNISIHELILNADGTYAEDSNDLVDGNVSYDNETRVLTFKIPDSSKSYRFNYKTDVTGDPAPDGLSNEVSLLGVDTQLEDTGTTYLVTEADGSATLERAGWIEITKINGEDNALPGVEFTLYAMDGTTAIRQGVTDNDGKLRLKAIPEGIYTLVETNVPDSYTLDSDIKNRSYGVEVIKNDDNMITSSVNGTGENTVLITNYEDSTVGDLIISKTVAGNGGSSTQKFEFTVTFVGANGSYDYIGNGVLDGTITSGDTVSLADGQSIKILNLPKNATYKVVESDYSGEGYSELSEGAEGTIVADEEVYASFTNTRNVGTLEIGKTVAGNGGDSNKAFDMTVAITDKDGNPSTRTYDYIGNGVPDGTITSGDTVSLADGQSITIGDILDGMAYKVEEADYTGDGYIESVTGDEGVIATDVLSAASFTNTRTVSDGGQKTGHLIISKTVVGTDTDKTFDFKVTLTGAPGSYRYIGKGTTSGSLSSGDTISLASGQSITIIGLPDGAKYQVDEATDSSVGYSVESIGDSGTISYVKDRIAAFTNVKTTGNLTISKKVTGEGAELNKKFDFTVTFTGAPGIYSYTGDYMGTISSGGIVALSNGESITITGLPEGSTYAVTEADYSEDGYKPVSTDSSGVISADTVQKASFTNDWTSPASNPGLTGNPDNVADGTTTGEGNIDSDVGGSKNGGTYVIPRTGDEQIFSPVSVGILGILAAAAAFFAAFRISRKKELKKI